MNMLELVVTERNRLIRFSILTSSIALILATWARDPLLSISTPYSGLNVGNLTVGHAILIGHPIVCVFFFLLTAQILRYRALAAQLPSDHREHLEWSLSRASTENLVTKLTHQLCEFFKWFAMVAIPALASFFLFFSQLDFENRHTDEEFSIRYLFSDHFFNIRPSYMGLHNKSTCTIGNDEEISDCKAKNISRETILGRMPKLYQPYNFLGGLILQVIVTSALVVLVKAYFLSPGRPRRQG